MSQALQNSLIIKKLSTQLGFSFCGISKAGYLETEAPRVEAWLNKGFNGQMQYLENHFDKRLDPTLLVPGAKSVVSLLYNYYPEKQQQTSDAKIAKYAYGNDYHDVLKDKCKELMVLIQAQIGAVEGRAFTDSAPVMERVWAEKSGLGWIGKHGLLINKGQGSFFFLSELILDLDCEYDSPIKDYCGSCTACVDACPTEAILPNKTLNASKCISYLTIELKDAIPNAFKSKMENWVFGCDICQDICPWNRFSKPNKEHNFTIKPEIENFSKTEWTEITEEVFNKVFSKSAVKRTKYEGFKRNLGFLE
ncbi:MAG: tRNA epoxyqueuosine(34) reductase QueG [bacterium]|nr:tRNA epoxyqueuosine(34) reductase QueG [bacterium]